MTLTIYELQDRLKEIDELSVLEILDITSEEIADKFLDKIEERYPKILAYFEEPDEDD